MSLHRWFIASLFCISTLLAFSQTQENKTIKHVPAPATSPASGKAMFKAYCAPCHGESGKGDGPAASALKVPPADLTVLGKNNGGKFPADKVASILRGQGVPAHGSHEMPVWGPVFWSMSHGHETEVQQRVANLIHYIESLQAK
jgi:mono/diheme cytochrome c family protein